MELKIELKPIGIIHSPYKTRRNAPPQGWHRPEVVSEVEVFDEYGEGLKDIEGFSYLHVLYWLHESEGYQLQITTPWDTELHGLFTTRSPNRPNPIGYSIVQLVGRYENVLRVRGLDALEGTLLLDIKPYVPEIDEVENARAGWLEGRMKIFTS
jgi:tRNA-Thr(GGU) m(6)t(6)A37 methyltransferase TsaA